MPISDTPRANHYLRVTNENTPAPSSQETTS
jgi:hypothetical protein